MARLSLALLGPFQAALDGKAIAGFEFDQVRALLAYLATESDRPHPPRGADRPAVARSARIPALTNLSHALYNLRNAIDDREAAIPL